MPAYRTALATALILGAVGTAQAAASPLAHSVAGRDYRLGEVVVRERTDHGVRARLVRTQRAVATKIEELAAKKDVVSATPNWIARASAFLPNDPGNSDVPGGWQAIQWNLLADTGINAPQAWENLILAGRPGGTGVVVAVLDTGVAYRNRDRFRISPDLDGARFRKGYDFVDNDPYPLDHNGHGTHVASTIAESADNGVGVAGIAYRAKIMPVRVLDRLGEGDSVAIARGIRYAARRGAKIINLSFEFSSTVTGAQIPDILGALRYARQKGALIVAASGNASASAVAYPARASYALSVGAVTEHNCMADYSNNGPGLDLSAPGGGPDAALEDDPNCRPADPPGRDIFQITFDGSVRSFGLPSGYMGTSMAAPHVSATAALVIASGVIGPNPSPRVIEDHLKANVLDLGPPGPDSRYGAGRIDAARATTPKSSG